MRVLFLINYAGAGGTEKYVKILAQTLHKNGDEVFFVYNEYGRLKEEMAGLCRKTIQLEMKSPYDLKAAKALAKICAENKVQIIHTQFSRENYIAILSKFYNNKAGIIHTSHINLENNFIWKLGNKYFMTKNKAVIAVCESVKGHLIKNNYPPKKIHVIHNGINIGPRAEKTGKIRKEFNIDGFLFVTLTRFSAEKGIFFLLESAIKLRALTDLPHTILMAGEGELLEEAREFARQNNIENVIFTGYRKDPEDILEAGDCFINSSQSEASSFAVFEAMGQGLPVIATNVGGNPDIINENTNCGMLVEYGQADAMAFAMKQMLENPGYRQRLSENALKAVENIFNIDITLKKTMDLYKKISAERGTK